MNPLSNRILVTTSIWLMRIHFGTAGFLLLTAVLFLLGAVAAGDWAGSLFSLLFGGIACSAGWVSTRWAQVALTPAGIEVRRLFGCEMKAPAEFLRVEAYGTLIRVCFQDGSKVYGLADSRFTKEVMPQLYFQKADMEWGPWDKLPGMRNHTAHLELVRDRNDIALINQRIRAWVAFQAL